MSRTYRKKGRKKVPPLIRLLLFLVLAFGAVKLGSVGGTLLYNYDNGIIQNMDAEFFKDTLTNSIPIIDMVYNSGKVSISFGGEVKNFIKSVFNFDLNSPVTVLNAQSSIFHSYYNTGYKQYMAQRERSSDIASRGDSQPDANTARPQENASSISDNENSEVKDPSPENIVSSGEISVINEPKLDINIEALRKDPLKIDFEKDKKGPKVIIYHTHTTEAYVSSINDIGKPNIPSNDKDEKKNVVRVGEELKQTLVKKYGIDVVHNATVHDYAPYDDAYNRSLDTVNKLIKAYPTAKIVLDIHRDGIGDGTQKLRTEAKVENKNVAQMMFIVGTNARGSNHPNWQENLKLAVKLQDKLNSKYPGIVKPIDIKSGAFNQFVSSGALLVEIGGDGNTLDEAIESTKYLAEAINDIINAK